MAKSLKNQSLVDAFQIDFSEIKREVDKVRKITDQTVFFDPKKTNPVDHRASKPVGEPLYSSSSLSNNKTTTTELSTALLNNNKPELEYWKQKNITEKQIGLWIKTVNCDGPTMLRYLSYCRFEMVDLGLEKAKPVENVSNWFYKILEKIGAYPKPKGYKSFEEKRLDEEREAVLEQKRIAHEQKEIYHKKIRAQQDAEFFKMLNNPDSEMYKKCFEKLNDFTKNRIKRKAFEISMRANFDELLDGD